MTQDEQGDLKGMEFLRTLGAYRTLRKDDEMDFYQRASRIVDRLSYEYHWAYIFQATRNRPVRFEDENAILYLTDKEWGNPYSPLVVVCGFDKYEGNKSSPGWRTSVQRIAQEAKTNHRNIIVKNVPMAERVIWEKLGFWETKEPWNKFSFRDDNTFPQYVFDFNSLVSRKSIKHSDRSSIIKFGREHAMKIRQYHLRDEISVRLLLEQFVTRGADEEYKDTKEELYRAHAHVFLDGWQNVIRLVHEEEGRLKGFSMLTRHQEAVFFDVLLNVPEKNIMRFLQWQALDYVARTYQGIRWVIHQGSESAGQDYWKRSFKPIRTIEKTHVSFL